MPIADRRAPPGNRWTLEARGALVGIVAFGALAGCAGRPPLPGPVLPLAATQDEPFRSRPLAPAIAGPIMVDPAPAVEEAILANGLKVWVIHRPRLPAIVLSLSVRLSPDQQRMISPELVHLTTRAVVEADTVWSDGKVVKPPTINSAWISYQTVPEGVTFSERILKSTLASGLEIIARTVRFPAFSEGRFADAQLEEMKATQDRSSSSDNQLLDIGLEAEFGPEVANQRRPLRPKEVRRATRTDAARCYEQLFRPDAALLVAVGDVTLPEVLAQATARFGDWRARPTEPIRGGRQNDQEGSRPDGRRVHLLAQGASAQNPVVVLQSAPPHVQIEDEVPFDLVAEIAAGSGSLRSRANTILRHDLGATYGVHSSIFEMAGRGVLALGGSFDATALEDAILGLLQVLDDMRARGVSPEELVTAKNRLAAAFDRRLSTNAGQAGVLSELFLQGKDLRWMSSYPDRLGRASVADLQRVALRYLDPSNADIVVAGPPSAQRTLGRVGAVHLYQLTKTSQ